MWDSKYLCLRLCRSGAAFGNLVEHLELPCVNSVKNGAGLKQDPKVLLKVW